MTQGEISLELMGVWSSGAVFHSFLSSALVVLTGQLHALTTFTPGRKPLVATELDAGRLRIHSVRFGEQKVSCIYLGAKHDFSIVQLVT